MKSKSQIVSMLAVFACMLAISVIMTTVVTAAPIIGTAKFTTFATLTPEQYDRLSGYLNDGDRQAFDTACNEGIYEGWCIILKKDQQVYYEGYPDGRADLVEIRLKGDPNIYCADFDHIDIP